MLLNVVGYILPLLFVSIDCRSYYRHRFMRQGNQPLFQFVGQAFEYPSSLTQSARTELSLNANPYAANVNPAKQMFYSPQSQPFQQFQPQMSLTTTPQIIATYPVQPNYLSSTPNRNPGPVVSSENNSNYQPIFNSKRRKKNIPNKKNEMVELLESGKKLLELPTMNGYEEDYHVIDGNSSSTANDINSNVTFLPIPSGMQLKSMSKQGGRKVDSTVNLTSSTEKIIAIDNTTEIENVVEMQMEKKIEDDKGANRGSEEVRIVETEHIKPIFHRKLNKLHMHNRRRKSYINMRSVAHRRSKRSKQAKEIKSDSIFDKMAKTFLTTISRKERVIKSNDFLNQRGIPNVATGRFDKIVRETDEHDKYESAHHRPVINDFLKFFFQEMSKIKKSQENSRNYSKPIAYSNETKKISNDTTLKIKGKKSHKIEDYPEHLNIVMNMNMTLESKVKRHKSKRYFDTPKITAAPNASNVVYEVSTTQGQIALFIFKTSNNIDYRFLQIVFLVVSMVFLVSVSMWMVPTFCRTRRIIPPPAMKGYGFYHGVQKSKILELLDYSDEKEYRFTEDYPRLEWQLENGDWLSE